MTDREKLIELLWGNHNDHPSAFGGLTDEFEHEADYIISHGVVVRDKGELIPVEPFANVWRCTACGVDYDMEDYATPMTWGINFCPSCGADLRRWKHDD